jgi:hypothetical protein
MTTKTLTRALVVCIFTFVLASITQAQGIQRTFVSTTGTDAGNCNPTAPCRTFGYALTQTTAGGEIIALTSGGYGPVEITKSVQITAPTGVYVAITVTPANAIGGTDAIRVNAGSGSTVVIRGLTLNNVGTLNANGITFPSGNRLYVENCVINGFDNHGIQVDRSSGSNLELFVTDTIIRNGNINDNDTFDAGIFLRQTASGILVRATITDCLLERAGYAGVLAADGSRATVRNTVSSRNNYGFASAASTNTASRLHIENSSATLNEIDGIVVGNYFAPISGGMAEARISSSAIGNNSNDGVLVNTNGTAYMSDSNVNGNGLDGVDIELNATAHISTSTINDNGNDGIELSNSATSVVFLTFTTISGHNGKGLNRTGNGAATTIGSNRIFNNALGSDPFSSTITQQ